MTQPNHDVKRWPLRLEGCFMVTPVKMDTATPIWEKARATPNRGNGWKHYQITIYLKNLKLMKNNKFNNVINTLNKFGPTSKIFN